jgi:hypothetical protein
MSTVAKWLHSTLMRVRPSQLGAEITMEYHTSIRGRGTCRETHRPITNAGYVLTTGPGLCAYHIQARESSLRMLGELTVNVCFPDVSR